jgi:mono/diheme cytochrome c family protein
MRRIRFAAFLFLSLTLSLGLLHAAGEKATGKDLFKAHCRTCHGPKGPAKEVTPMTLIQEQWERFFKDKFASTHAAAMDPARGGKPVPETIPAEDLEKIKQFAIDHAADSEQPSTCG